ncbi:proteasome component M29, partial [Coemansia sp. RSA 1694]
SIRESFRCAWREFTLGSGSKLIEKHVDELLGLPLAFLGDDSWARRVQSAAAISDLTRVLERAARAQTEGNRAVQALARLADLVLPSLVQASQGRVWPGKAQVLECLVLVCTASAKTASDDTMPRVVCDLLLREIPRGDLAYRRLAVTHFSALVEAAPALDVYSEASAVLLDIIARGMSSAAAMDMDVDEEPLQRPLQLLLIAAAVRALLLALPKTRVLAPEEAASAARVLCEIARDGIWNIRVASLECLQALVAHCCAGSEDERAGRMRALDMAKVLDAVGACAAEGKYVAVRTAALGALEAVLDALAGDGDTSAGLWDVARGVLDLLAIDPIPSI